MATAYDNVVRPTGNPTDHTPLYAWPHVVAAVCWVLWRAEGDQPRDIDAWLTRVQHAMRARTGDPTVQPASQELDDAAIGWLQDLPGEERLPWLAYRGSMSRRALAGDPDTDAVICLLEAAARNPTARQEALFRQALDHPKRSVRWTAARLGAKHVPQALEGVAAGSEEDALVRARLLAPR